ncbi:hypothetical protein [Pseudoclavibacter sp. 13-3]|uniref:hypothetical protein n=1 Tax=Pseudoclavibacter sp. 13-3 TaxID=2901228 RepID=UPI001E62AD13|nr:hypothetical protein [Pseudoclavibacter sp. 13-3]MCD7100819.1 hypothetical protein [Pseudoclavibacter sp. 13-3]
MNLTRITIAWTALTVAMTAMLFTMRAAGMPAPVVLIWAEAFLATVLFGLGCALLVREMRRPADSDTTAHASLAARVAALETNEMRTARLVRAIARVEAAHDLFQSSGKARARVDLIRELERQRRLRADSSRRTDTTETASSAHTDWADGLPATQPTDPGMPTSES